MNYLLLEKFNKFYGMLVVLVIVFSVGNIKMLRIKCLFCRFFLLCIEIIWGCLVYRVGIWFL